MPRAIWSGSISFGLVNVPVRMFSAVSEHTLHFHYVHEPDGSRIGYERVCKAEGKAVPDDEIVKAFEWSKGEWVYLDDEDFEAAKTKAFHTIEIKDFVPQEEIDPIYFRHTYYLAPDKGAEQVYALLREALEQSALVGISTLVMRDREHLGCVRVREQALCLEQMYFADEIRPPDELAPPKAKVDRRELELAQQLIDTFSGPFEPERYRDTYRDTLCEIIEAKRKGEEVHLEEVPEEEAPSDLMEALRRSVEAARGRRGGGERPRSSDGDGRAELEGLSKDELYERAKRAKVPGRAQMTKEELVTALSNGS
jgi:DNA end-binding protein Ku